MHRLPATALLSPLVVLALLTGAASGEGYGGDAEVREILRTAVTADGQPIRYPQTDRPEVTAVVLKLPPGGQTGWHAHRAPVYAYVIEGTLEVEREDGAVRTYQAGEAFAELVGTPHNGRAHGERTVKLVAFYTGEQGTPPTTRLD